LFTGLAVLFLLGLAGSHYYEHRRDPDYDVAHLRRSALTTYVVLTVGLVYLVLGFAEASLQETPKRKRRRIRPVVDDTE